MSDILKNNINVLSCLDDSKYVFIWENFIFTQPIDPIDNGHNLQKRKFSFNPIIF
ncbi:MAG: hypothetical protein N4R61_02775 [Lactobacillus iners]|nr:hypothetical protein [Lactobacillus iners]